ncbi:hypothetical protein F5Y07DRAFT_360784 [Xylaria sp. FL0933]|nr:hypothetical protein F5Y07DRAFT_360784 [Xylaria sp. FL0933]
MWLCQALAVSPIVKVGLQITSRCTGRPLEHLRWLFIFLYALPCLSHRCNVMRAWSQSPVRQHPISSDWVMGKKRTPSTVSKGVRTMMKVPKLSPSL